jgi:hypothetical protein
VLCPVPVLWILTKSLQVAFLLYILLKFRYLIRDGDIIFDRLVDSVNLALICYTTYQIGVTNFGDYEPLAFLPWYAVPKELYSKFKWRFQEPSRKSV